MSRTLLYTVQRVLEKLDLDAVNSINDTPDSILIAREAEDTFFDLLSRNEWPERYDIINIESVIDVSNPTALRLPDDVLRVHSIRYDTTTPEDTDKCYKELIKLEPEEFLDKIYARNSSDASVTTANYKGIELFVYNDKMPTYYTVFDNEYVILDSYDSSVESTVQGSKTVARGSTAPVFTLDDAFVIPLDAVTYPLYLSEVTASCSLSLNGTNDLESERRRNRGISRMRRSAFRTGTSSLKNKFGRLGTGRA